MSPANYLALAAVLLVVVLALRGFVIIQQSETMVVERLGRYHRTLDSGIHIIWPFFDVPRRIVRRTGTTSQQPVLREVSRIDLRETAYDFPRQNVITRDNVVTEVNALLYFQIVDPRRAVYEIANLNDAIEKLTQTTLRQVIGEMDLDESLTSRDRINRQLTSILDEATTKWGVKINRVELQDITPPQDIRQAMEKQMRAERDRRARILEAEGFKQAQILEAEGTRQSDVNRAEGEKAAQVLRAQGEAEALRLVSEAVNLMSAEALRYAVAQRYLDAFTTLNAGSNNKLVYLPYEATAVLGALGGLSELLGKPHANAPN